MLSKTRQAYLQWTINSISSSTSATDPTGTTINAALLLSVLIRLVASAAGEQSTRLDTDIDEVLVFSFNQDVFIENIALTSFSGSGRVTFHYDKQRRSRPHNYQRR